MAEFVRTIAVAAGGETYPIRIGPGLLAQLEGLLAPLTPSAILVVTDGNVDPLYGDAVERVLQPVARTRRCVLTGGESQKSWPAVAYVIDALLALPADRRSVVLALGGGVVGDIAGFAASVFMRGIRLVQVPTTLLAQVDSSVGGKTGVNHPLGKNLIGAFHQPVLVVSDTEVLASLPQRELSAGLAEVLKHGLLADEPYFARVERDLPKLLGGDSVALAAAIARSCEIKAQIVARDAREKGERALLNLGHTFAHAIEALTHFEQWLHGEAVGCGLCLAADMSRRLGNVSSADVQRIEVAVATARLPVRIAGLDRAAALASMRGDKKVDSGRVQFIALERIGRAVQRTVADEIVAATLEAGGYVGGH